MSFNISTDKQTNLWGKQSPLGTDIGLEPQRNDLFMIDFTNAVKNIESVSVKKLAPILPQYVRSCTLPELRTKAEPIRRDSVPYNTPSWDDPLDAIKVVFLLETGTQTYSSVIAFLDLWLALTRAGRGGREFGYYGAGWFKLNANYSVDYTFDVFLHLLRGANATNSFPQHDAFNLSATTVGRSQAELERVGNDLSASVEARANPGNLGGISNLVLHATYRFKSAWLGAYKMSDYSYSESGLVTVEATFYAESCTTLGVAIASGASPRRLSSSDRPTGTVIMTDSGLPR